MIVEVLVFRPLSSQPFLAAELDFCANHLSYTFTAEYLPGCDNLPKVRHSHRLLESANQFGLKGEEGSQGLAYNYDIKMRIPVSRVREKIPDLQTMLAEIRLRPGMYLGTKSILAIDHQLMGIYFAEDFHKIPKNQRFGGFDIEAFEKWVDETLNTERLSVRSMYLAYHVAGSDSAGFDLWFEWYDRYCRETSN